MLTDEGIMKELLENFSAQQILLYGFLLGAVVKSTVDFFDWANHRLKKFYGKSTEQEDFKQLIEAKFDTHSRQIEETNRIQTENQEEIKKIFMAIEMLLMSDRDDIKAWITEKHHYFCAQGWIDDYNLDCMEKRFSHYEDEGGNSFIKGLMAEVRSLPKVDPNK